MCYFKNGNSWNWLVLRKGDIYLQFNNDKWFWIIYYIKLKYKLILVIKYIYMTIIHSSNLNCDKLEILLLDIIAI